MSILQKRATKDRRPELSRRIEGECPDTHKFAMMSSPESSTFRPHKLRRLHCHCHKFQCQVLVMAVLEQGQHNEHLNSHTNRTIDGRLVMSMFDTNESTNSMLSYLRAAQGTSTFSISSTTIPARCSPDAASFKEKDRDCGCRKFHVLRINDKVALLKIMPLSGLYLYYACSAGR